MLVNTALLVWVAIRRYGILRGWTEPAQHRRIMVAVIGVFFGTASIVVAITCFVEHTFRNAIGSVGADILGAFWVVFTVGWFLITWMMWTGRTRVPAGRGS